MLINWLRRVEIFLLKVVELPISLINWLSSSSVRGLRSLQDKIKRSI
jgi:hypothetical protein